MKQNRITARFFNFAIFSVLICMFAGTISVYASNYHDTKFSFVFGNNQNVTEVRIKEDKSPIYMTCYDANCSYVAYVLCGDSATDCNESGSEPYKFSKGTTRKMPFTGNWDMGFRYVQILGIAQTSSPNASAWGYWSPDSI